MVDNESQSELTIPATLLDKQIRDAGFSTSELPTLRRRYEENRRQRLAHVRTGVPSVEEERRLGELVIAAEDKGISDVRRLQKLIDPQRWSDIPQERVEAAQEEVLEGLFESSFEGLAAAENGEVVTLEPKDRGLLLGSRDVDPTHADRSRDIDRAVLASREQFAYLMEKLGISVNADDEYLSARKRGISGQGGYLSRLFDTKYGKVQIMFTNYMSGDLHATVLVKKAETDGQSYHRDIVEHYPDFEDLTREQKFQFKIKTAEQQIEKLKSEPESKGYVYIINPDSRSIALTDSTSELLKGILVEIGATDPSEADIFIALKDRAVFAVFHEYERGDRIKAVEVAADEVGQSEDEKSNAIQHAHKLHDATSDKIFPENVILNSEYGEVRIQFYKDNENRIVWVEELTVDTSTRMKP